MWQPYQKTRAEVIRDNGFDHLERISSGQFKTIDPKTKTRVMKDYITYSAVVSKVTVRIMVVDKINDVAILSSIMQGYHLIVNEKDFMLLQQKGNED